MKTLKKLLIILLSLSMILSLFACNKTEEPVDTTEITAESQTVSIFDYSVVYADGVSEDVLQEIKKMHAKLTALSGQSNSLAAHTAEAADSAAKEILIGATDRSESEQLASELVINEYAVAVVGNKLVITAITEANIKAAVQYFTATYLADGADGNIAKDLYHKETDGTVCLVDRGVANYTFVRRNGEIQKMLDQMFRMSDAIINISKVSLPVKDDYIAEGESHNDEAYEILFGSTNYSQTHKVASGVAPDNYGIVAEGNKIVLYAWNLEMTTKAVDDFCNMIANADLIRHEDGKVSVLLPRTLFVMNKNEVSEYFADVPHMADGKLFNNVYDCHDNTLMMYWENATEAMFTSYSAELEQMGFAKHQTLNNDTISSATYTLDGNMAHIYYLKKVSEFRVVTQADAKLAVNPYAHIKVCSVAVTQIGIGTGTGMNYLIRLEDGTFVVIDGNWIRDVNVDGVNIGDTPDMLFNTMKEQLPTGVTDIVISAWYLTHGHGDHYGMIREFMSRYESQVKLKMLIGNDASAQIYKDTNHNRAFDFTSLNGRFGGCYYKKTHTGEQFFFPGITFTTLYTHEDMFPDTLEGIYNNLSTVFDGVVKEEVFDNSVKDGQTRFLWIGDAQTKAANRITKMYGNTLKSDVFQIGHHGNRNGGSLPLYQAVDPIVVFWCSNLAVFEQWEAATHNIWIVENAEIIHRHDQGNYTVSFGAAAADNGYPLAA